MRRSLVTLSLGALLMSVPNLAAAQEPPTVGLSGALAAADLATSDLASAITAKHVRIEQVGPVASAYRSDDRTTLVALSVTAVALQGLDVYTTLAAVNRGALEANPMMRGAVHNPAMFIAVKTSMTAATIYGARRLWPRHKAAAVTVLAIGNAVMATVVARNLSVLNQVK